MSKLTLPTDRVKLKAKFQAALDMVIEGDFRRAGVTLIDEKGYLYDCTIYRCSENLVRCDFKKYPIDKKIKTLLR